MHELHILQASPSGCKFSQLMVLANMRAQVVLPIPRGPQKRKACASDENLVASPEITPENAAKKTVKSPITPDAKKGLLESLREQHSINSIPAEVKEAEPLSIEKLRTTWQAYTAKLEEQQKHSSVVSFKTARLNIETDIKFTITVSALTQQRFIEQEKTSLADYIQQAFNNRSIIFKIYVEEGIKEEVSAHLQLNSRQRFEKIAEQYPLVKELKDRLKLEIDY